MRVLTDWLLTPQRAAVHLPSRTAVVADLHLGYNQARRQRGEAVPECSAERGLAVLDPVLRELQLQRLVIAGDLLEGGRAEGVLDELRHWRRRTGLELVVVPGNHDRELARALAAREQEPALVEFAPDGTGIGEFLVVHGDGELPARPLVQGHEHPCVRWNERLGGPCYLVGGDRLILPAFSPDAAGVNVLGDRRWHGFRCYAIAGDRVLDFGELAALHARTRTGRDP
jgi:putative SbcD/Mre11-related phosphoesterase